MSAESESERVRAAERMEALSRLAGGVAHELNNVLMVITGYAEMLGESDSAGRETQDALRLIAEAAQRATNITRQLLLFGRRQVTEAADVAVSTAMAAALREIKALVPASAKIRVSIDNSPLYVHMDPSHLERLVVGLAVFSREAVPEGATLTIDAQKVTSAAFIDAWGHEAPAGDYVRVTVGHSTAVEPGVRARLFEPFFTSKPIGKGAALSLAVAYGIVRSGRGYIDIVPDGSGSRFEVHLPLVALRDSARHAGPITAYAGHP